MIVLSAETQLLAVFILAVATGYTQGGSLLAKALDDYAENIHTELKKVDEIIAKETKTAIEQNKQLLTIQDDYKHIESLVDELSVAQADILNYSAEHKYRDAIVKKLDALVAMEESVTTTIRQKMVKSVTADVIKKFSTDTKIQEAALDQAIAVLAAGSTGKLGKDIVGSVFQNSIKLHKEEFAKKSPELEEIIANLNKDVTAVTTPPVVESTGGNVYITHPIITV